MGSKHWVAGVVSVVALLAAAVFEPAAAPAADADRGKPKLARGKTSQNRGIAAKVYGRRLQMLDFNAVLKCRDGSELIVEEGGFLPIDLRAGGRFSDVQYGRTDTVRLRGRVGKSVVRGRLRVQDRWGKTPCDSRWFKFTARDRGRAPRRSDAQAPARGLRPVLGRPSSEL